MEHLDTILQIILVIIPFIFGILARFPQYWKAKSKITEFRDLIDIVDDAVIDDNINEEEFRKIFNGAKKLINK